MTPLLAGQRSFESMLRTQALLCRSFCVVYVITPYQKNLNKPTKEKDRSPWEFPYPKGPRTRITGVEGPNIIVFMVSWAPWTRRVKELQSSQFTYFLHPPTLQVKVAWCSWTLTQRVHVPNNLVLGFWVMVVIVQVLGRYMIIRYLDHQGKP